MWASRCLLGGGTATEVPGVFQGMLMNESIRGVEMLTDPNGKKFYIAVDEPEAG